MNMHSAKVYGRMSCVSTRRQFLAGAVAGTAALYAWPLWAITDGKTLRSRVALLENPRIMTDLGILKRLLVEAFEEGLCASLHKPTPVAAWQGILHKDDRILLKCSRADADRLATGATMAEVVV